MRTPYAVLALAIVGAACGGRDKQVADSSAVAATPAPSPTPLPAPGADTAARGAASGDSSLTVEMRDATGRALGTLTVTESARGITVAGRLTGLPPGTHAIHLHTTGKCEPPFTSAGGHWNPTNRQHGTENPQGPHLGDLPNITVGADSTASVDVTSPGGTLRGANGLLDADGAAVMVHAKADDNRTDPAGNAGDRIACGVIPARP